MSRYTLVRDIRVNERLGVTGLTVLCTSLGEGVAIYWTPESRLGSTSVQNYQEKLSNCT